MSFPVLTGAALFPVAQVSMSLTRVLNSSIARHGHDFQEIVLVVAGQAEHQRFAPGAEVAQCYTLGEGDIFWLPVGWSHAYQNTSRFEIYNLLFDAALLGDWGADNELFKALRQPSAESVGELQYKLHLRRAEREALESLLRVIMRELTLQTQGFEIAVRAKVVEVLVFLQRLQNATAGQFPALWNQTGVIAQAISFIEERFAEPIALRDIARAVHLSPNYFCEQFAATTGQTPGRYLLRLRLEHARYLLLTTSDLVTEIARQSGFADPSYFARAFKAHFGVAPSRMRFAGN